MIAVKGSLAPVLDAQVVSEHVDLDVAHTNNKYKPLTKYIKQRYKVETVDFGTITLSSKSRLKI